VDYLTQNWGHPKAALFAVAVVFVHEFGLRRLNGRSTAAHAVRRRRRLWFTYAGVAVVTISICSPLEFWSMQYFWVHMLQHIAVMLAAPALYVAGRPFMALLFALPVGARRRLLRAIYQGRHEGVWHRVGHVLVSPWFAIAFLNVVMVVWMLPPVFNPVMANEQLHVGLMLSTFFISGLLFWLQFIPSRPFALRLSAFGQVTAVVVSNVVMTIIAISISFLTTHSLYVFGSSAMGMSTGTAPHITLSPYADQQIGAAILWVCGDFWAFPILIIAVRRMMREDRGSTGFGRRMPGEAPMTSFRGVEFGHKS